MCQLTSHGNYAVSIFEYSVENVKREKEASVATLNDDKLALNNREKSLKNTVAEPRCCTGA